MSNTLNKLIDRLNFEIHLPYSLKKSYQYCGPGTNLQERLARGDRGINKLDEACKFHDIAYSQSRDNEYRRKADQVLLNAAWDRFKSKDAGYKEKAASWIVTNAMKAKVKLGQGVSLKHVIKQAGSCLKCLHRKKNKNKKKGEDKSQLAPIMSEDIISKSLAAAKKSIGSKKHRRVHIPRVLPLPKTGGVLPLIPIFAGLSALGSLTGGVAGIIKSINEAKEAKEQLTESQRHNQTMEALAIKNGKGLYLKPYKEGLGLYIQSNDSVRKTKKKKKNSAKKSKKKNRRSN
uniref:Phospholipase A2-like domain-containing protein n=1 Tax=Cacopsylla melanoneura TaxID=428564 RepID=A0A8D8X9A8_9HEMI